MQQQQVKKQPLLAMMMMNNDNCGNGSGGGSIGGDSDSSSDSKVCRDFMRNVCQRGKSCRFIHPENIKIRTDPIFCHDFQQGRCFRANCKFIHCNRDDEEHYKLTGELPPGVHETETTSRFSNKRNGSTSNGNYNSNGMGMGEQNQNGNRNVVKNNSRNVIVRNGTYNGEMVQEEVPICKDFLKGVCDRPPGGCKYRHVNVTLAARGPMQNSVTNVPNVGIGGGPFMNRGGMRGRGGTMQPVATRRKLLHEMYDEGPDAKRYQMDEYAGGFDEFESEEYNPVYPPPPPRGGILSGQVRYLNNYPTTTTYSTVNTVRNGYQTVTDSLPYYQTSSHSDAMKALEDENFMLKRRIEELKSSNEFLLNQNAQLRLNNSLGVGTSVAQVQPLAVSAVSVSGTGPAAQPSIIGITSSLNATQPMPTISISTLPTVSSIPPVSISQSLQPQPQSQTQTIYIPTPNQGIN